MSPYDDQGVAALMPGMAQPAAGMTQPTGSYTGYKPPSYLYQPPPGAYDWGGFAPGQMAAMYNPLAYYSPNNYGYGYTPPNAGYGYGQGTGTGTGTGTGDGFFHMPGAPTPAAPSVAPQVYYPPQGGRGGRPTADFNTTNDWTTTSENAYNWSNAGQNLMPVSPFFGAMAGMYGNYLARHVDPNYGHEAMRAPAPPTAPEGQAIIGPDGSVISASDPSRWGSETNPTYGGVPAANPMSSDPAQQAQAAQAAAAQAAAQAANNTGYSGSVFGPSISAADAASAASNGESGTNIAGPFGYTSSQFSATPYAGNVQVGSPPPAASVTAERDIGPPAGSDNSPAGEGVGRGEGGADSGGEHGAGGPGGGGEKKGGVIRRKKQKSNFADGGIVDLVRQYPWLLR